MYINEKIEYLHKILLTVRDGYLCRVGVYERLLSWSIVGLLNDINIELEELNKQLDQELNLEAIRIKFHIFNHRDYWDKIWPTVDFKKVYAKDGKILFDQKYTSEINKMTDYLPNGKEDYLVTPDVLYSFKSAMHQLCDEDKITYGELEYTLNSGLDRMLILLNKIRLKVTNPQKHLFTKLWDEISKAYSHYDYKKEYNEWMDNIVDPSFDDLKARQKLEIYKFLNKNFLRYCITPTGAEIKKES